MTKSRRVRTRRTRRTRGFKRTGKYLKEGVQKVTSTVVPVIETIGNKTVTVAQKSIPVVKNGIHNFFGLFASSKTKKHRSRRHRKH